MTNITISLNRHQLTGKLEPYSGAGLSSFKLATGHYVTKQFDMVAVSPRPDSETGDFSGTVYARHRFAYYDGVNPVQYEWPVSVFGGAAPHIFELLNGPTGMTVSNSLNPSDHGVVKWVPTQDYSTGSPAVVTVRVYDQNLSYIEITWTIATSSSTSKFIFLNMDSGSDGAGDGSISNPFKTIAKVTGTTISSVTYPGRIVYLRGSTTAYTSMYHSDHAAKQSSPAETEKYICVLNRANIPTVFVTFPGESVTIDFSASEYKVTTDDFCFMGSSTSQLRITGSAVLAAVASETHNFWMEVVKRWSFKWITFDGFIPRSGRAGWTNIAPIFSPYDAGYTGRMYCDIFGCKEINRTQAVANDGLLFILFGTNYTTVQYSTGVKSIALSAAYGARFKAGNHNTSMRYSDLRLLTSDAEPAIDFGCQTTGSNGELVYCNFQGHVHLNKQNGPSTTGKFYVGRCNILAYSVGASAGQNAAVQAWATGTATFVSENNVLISKDSPQYQSSQGVTSTGNECLALTTGSDLPLDTTTLLLKNSTTQYRTLYLGIRGSEIA